MGTTKEDIKIWIDRGIKEKATHVIIVCDTFDYEDYPVMVKSSEDVHEIIQKYNGKNMQKIMEVYNLKLNIEQQLNEHRTYNI